ncbi:MAG: ATP-binding protein [Actinomycetes bacterium]
MTSDPGVHDRRAYLETVLRGLGEGVVHVRQDRSIEPLNGAASELLGLTDAELRRARVGDGPWELRLLDGSPCPPGRSPWARGLAGEEVTGETIGLVDAAGSVRWLRMTTRRVDHPDGGVVASYQDVSETVAHQATVRRLRTIERLVAGVSTELVQVRPGDVDAAIVRALEQLGATIDVDRAYVFSSPVDEPSGPLDQTHVWARSGVRDFADVRRGVDAELMPWWMARVRALEPIVIERVEDLPAEALRERHIFGSQGVRSLVCVPMVTHDLVLGFVGLDSCRAHRRWEDDEVRLLRLVGEAFAGAIERRRVTTALAQANALLVERNDELEERNEQLRDAGRVKDEFLSVTSHELRTPLTTIRGAVETMRVHGDQVSQETRAELLEAIGRQAHRLERLVDDLLVTSRLASDTVTVDPHDVPVLAAVVELVTNTDVPGVEVDGDPAAVAHVDPDHLARMVENLLQNARRYGAPPVLVTVRPGATHVVLEVRDHGPGVPATFRAQLFERFTQASRGTRREAWGTGLGLAIVRDLARLNGGDVVHEDADPGARFVVTLPVPSGTTGG